MTTRMRPARSSLRTGSRLKPEHRSYSGLEVTDQGVPLDENMLHDASIVLHLPVKNLSVFRA